MGFPELSEGKYLEKVLGSGNFYCRDCGALVMAVNHYGFGSDEHGFMFHEQIPISQEPFCPKCEKQPT